MILVDTSIWIDHFHAREPRLVDLLEAGEIGTHRIVIEELALGSIRRRDDVLQFLGKLRHFPPLTHAEVLTLTECHRLWGRGTSGSGPPVVGLGVDHGAGHLLLGADSRSGDGAVPMDHTVPLEGQVTGPDVTVWFGLSTLHPALSLAIGSDAMIELRGTDQPATIRSADDGDLTTVVMPCRAPIGPGATTDTPTTTRESTS